MMKRLYFAALMSLLAIMAASSCKNVSKAQAPAESPAEEVSPEDPPVPVTDPVEVVEADPVTYHPAPFLGEENDILLGKPLSVSYCYEGEESGYWVDLWFDEAGRIARRRTRSDFGDVEDASNRYEGDACVYSEVVNENGTLIRKRELSAIEDNRSIIKETTPGLVREIWQEEITYLEGCYEVRRDSLLARRVFFNDKGQTLVLEEYDNKGRLKETDTYTYDAEGRIVNCSIQDPREWAGPAVVFTFSYRDIDGHGNWTVQETRYDDSEEGVGGILRRSIRYRE